MMKFIEYTLIFLIFPFSGISITLLGMYIETRRKESILNDIIGYCIPLIIILIMNLVIYVGPSKKINISLIGKLGGFSLAFFIVGVLSLISGVHNAILRVKNKD